MKVILGLLIAERYLGSRDLFPKFPRRRKRRTQEQLLLREKYQLPLRGTVTSNTDQLALTYSGGSNHKHHHTK